MKVLLLLWLTLWCAAKAVATASNCRFSSKTGRVLLFSIRAHSGRNALTEYNNFQATHTLSKTIGIPAFFRSNLLNDLPTAVEQFCANRIVVEMQKAGKTVAKAEFDVTDSAGLDSHNWFTPSRLVQTYPFWTGKTGFVDFGIKGHSSSIYSRDFYIQHNHGECSVASGLMGIGESNNDSCSWVTNGGSAPVLFYAKQQGPYSKKSVVDYADQFIIYMRHRATGPDPFFLGPDKMLLFSIRAHSGKSAKMEYLNKEVQNGLPATQDIPPLYRSGLLNNLTGALEEFKANQMVVEMLKNGTAVARAEFDVGPGARDGLDLESWLSPKRLVKSYPFWPGSFVDYGISGYSSQDGHWNDTRTFYINQGSSGCSGEGVGLMGISESRKDPCRWVTDGGQSPPILFYGKKHGARSANYTVGYADQFIIYMKHVSVVEGKFTYKKVFMCLKPEFIQNAPAEVSSPDDCASHCIAQHGTCQGFRFRSPATGAKCQLFVFTKCSHDVNAAPCTNYEWVHVRNQAGLPPGSLCPSSYGYRHGSSAYKIVPSVDWNAGLSSCGSDFGLTKFSDADDVSEVTHMLGIMQASRWSLFLGGKKVDSIWKWVKCNTNVSPETWRPGQSSYTVSGYIYTGLITSITNGMFSSLISYYNHALCECVDPFVDSRLFTFRKVFMCLKPEFIENATGEKISYDDCASSCIAQGSRCQGFRFQSQANSTKCHLFVFTKCSHDVNIASCSSREWVHVRNQAGLPPGKLCPSSYEYKHGSSVYSIVDALSWHNGSARCSSDPGLAKYADVSDLAESTHMNKLREQWKKSFFIGGRMTSPANYQSCTKSCNSTWEWVSCNAPIATNLWESGQPKDITHGYTFVDIWLKYTTGIGTTRGFWRKRGIIDHALCECVNPFD